MKKYRSDKWYLDHDLTGKTFGRLTVLGLSDLKNTKNRSRLWVCVCTCGNIVIKDTKHLNNGHAKSCGCLQKEHMNEFKEKFAGRVTHGMSRERLFRIWSSMIKRCSDEKYVGYMDYGGRGITVCDEWKDLETFVGWANSHGYSDDLSIDRIDNNSGYCPDNCRWVDNYVQANNKRNNTLITYRNETHTLPEWSRITGIKQCTLRYRLKAGWQVNDIIERPVINQRPETINAE